MPVKNGIELATRGLITQSPLAQAKHTTICRHILRKTSSCGLCKAHMLTVLIFCVGLWEAKKSTNSVLVSFL